MGDESPIATPLLEAVTSRLLGGLRLYLDNADATARAIAEAGAVFPPEFLEKADRLLRGYGTRTGRKRVGAVGLSYRDGLLIQLAWGLEAAQGYDHTQRGEGARTVAQALGRANHQLHIPKVNDAYENIGKNSANLVRGNVDEFDELLPWMNAASAAERALLLNYGLAQTALTARAVKPMPELRPVALTFAAVNALLDDFLKVPSGGAHEQFAVAAFLGAMLDQFSSGSLQGLQVRTKNINASDASSGTGGDVQIIRGNLIEAVFEVSANDWRSKVDQAIEAARRTGLQSAHIIAAGADISDLGRQLQGSTVDVTVSEVGPFLRVICATLRPPAREDALRRLYDMLDRLQPNTALTNGYVDLLGRHALAAERPPEDLI